MPLSSDKSLLGNETKDTLPSDSTDVFLVSLGLNAGIAVVILSLFSHLRTRIKRLYAPRLILLDTMFPLGKLPNSSFAWIMPAFMANDDDIFFYSGIDAFVYIRFMKLCFKISLILLPYGIAVLLPLNHYGGMDATGLDKLTMSNIKERSPKLWAHLVAVWGYTLVICYLLYEEWRVYVLYRQEHLSKGLRSQYTVFVSELPTQLQDEDSMKAYVEKLFPGQVEDVTIVEDLSIWKKMIKLHDKLVLKQEKAQFNMECTGERPSHTLNLCGDEIDSLTFYEDQLQKLQVQLEEEMNKKHCILPCAFVVFKSLKAANIAAQCLWDNVSMKVNVEPAPDVKAVIWGNLSIGFLNRQLRTVLVWLFLFFLVFFWTIPTSFVSSLIALDNLRKLVPFLGDFDKYPSFVRLFIKGFLSSIALWLFYLILPWLVRLLTTLEGVRSKSEVDELVLGRLFVFKAVNQFLFLSLAGSALNKLREMIDAPKEIPDFLATTLPSQSTFFISLIMLYALPFYSLELLQLFPLILWPFAKCSQRTPREEKESWRPSSLPYDQMYSDHLLMFMVGLSYSVLAPLISPFVVMYFGFGCVVWTYQVLCVYIPTHSTGGKLWPVIFNRMVASLIIFHLLMIGIFGLKENFTIALLVLPLPVITSVFYYFMQQYYYEPSRFLSQEMASGLSEASPRVLQEAVQGYVRNNRLPTVFGLSTDNASERDQLEYEEIQTQNERTRLVPSPPRLQEERVDLVVL
ncbi:CSC1-like protein ERD4 [Nematostella vectensis]|uniref:CSC1-like protein ERD4 n=1 Tax=Nematostella vectensis TaxID=45351 RepID=UPI0020777FD2|nr:CSC1-like protein ERD4 [Nematostella vectensis]